MYTYNITVACYKYKHYKLYAFFLTILQPPENWNHYQYLPSLLFCKNYEIQTDKEKHSLTWRWYQKEVCKQRHVPGRDPSKHWWANGQMLKINCDKVLVLEEMWYLPTLGRGGIHLLWEVICTVLLWEEYGTVLLWEEIWYIPTLRRHMVHPHIEKRYATTSLWEGVWYIPTLKEIWYSLTFFPVSSIYCRCGFYTLSIAIPFYPMA